MRKIETRRKRRKQMPRILRAHGSAAFSRPDRYRRQFSRYPSFLFRLIFVKYF